MGRTTTITLDGITYTVRAFNIGELERIQTAQANAWSVLKIALERADPKIEDPNVIEPTPSELEDAFKKILDLAGLKSDPQAAGSPPVP